jgi:lysophospholipase L1-like esterase
MFIHKTAFVVFLFLFYGQSGFSQHRHTTKKQAAPAKKAIKSSSPQINVSFNRIFNGSIASFYDKLSAVKKADSGVVRVVHIGDSHLQADFLTAVVRNGLQQMFGNAGRGLVFPYQVARSNAPSDIISSSNMSWQYNRLVNPGMGIATGISGFCVQTNMPGATINLGLRPNAFGEQSFNRIKFFTGAGESPAWQLQAGTDSLYCFRHDSANTMLYKELFLDQPVTECVFSTLSADTTNSLYGLSLENSQPGILYHTIGVNGARYDQYNSSPLFWKQLPGLEADLYIISLGTNEAQANSFDGNAFKSIVDTFLQKLKAASPGAAILITTAADSYKGKRPNLVLKQLNNFLANYCATNHVALWDLYRVTNGYGSARNWLRKGWMNKDRVHFLQAGYQIQGGLLLEALKKGYEQYSSAY